jgi:dihydroflavonol-4-reductase
MGYFVTGATGLIGTHVVEQLVDEGYDVVALTRSRSNASHLPEEATVVEGDITNKASMREPMTGVDGVYHIAAWFYTTPGSREVEKAERINIEGTRNVLELMDDLDIPKGVYTSTTGVYPGTSGETLDESIDPPRPTWSKYARTKWEAHFEVARPLMEDGLPLVIVQPSGVYGPHGGTSTELFRNYLTGDVPMIPRNWAMAYDHAEDIAQAHLKAMEEGTPGEEYIISSQARTMVELLECAEEITGIPAPRPVPDAVFATLATVMRNVERVTTPPEGFESEALDLLAGRQWYVDNSKAKRELGVEFRSLEEGLRDYLPWELDQLGMETRIEQPPTQ